MSEFGSYANGADGSCQTCGDPTELLEAALGYASRRRPVFPVRADKRPFTRHGFKDATTDQAQIRRWWEQWPDAGIATPTGNGLLVIDVDDHRAAARLEREHGPLPPTVEVVTPRPGRHIYLAGRAGCNRGRLPAGVDVRGDGGYVLLPPSSHELGAYEWRTAPDEAAVAPAPEWLLELLTGGENGNGPAPAVEGDIPATQRNSTLASMAGTMRRRGFTEAAITEALLATNRERCTPPLDEHEVRSVAHSIARYRPLPPPPARREREPTGVVRALRGLDQTAPQAGPASGANVSHRGREIRAERFSAIKTERTSWLWAGRIPLGTATLLVGREKLGKSTLTVELAARLSRGELDGDLRGAPAVSLIVSYEDHAASTIKPRLLAAGADVNLVHRVRAERDGNRDLVSLPGDVEQISRLACETSARLLIVDPLSASLNGDIDSHRDQDIRRALAPLVQLAEEASLAVLCLAHWNKSPGGDSLSRVLGSRGLTAGVRSVLAFGRHPDAEDDTPDRVLAHPACNLAREAPSLTCKIEPHQILGDDGETLPTTRLLIGEEVDVHSDDLLTTRNGDDRTDVELAMEWLADELADGQWIPSRMVRERGKAAGHSERTLQRAKGRLGAEDRRDGFQAVSEWRLPVAPTPSEDVGATGAGATGKTRINTGDSVPEQPQSRQDTNTGATGAGNGVEATPQEEALYERSRTEFEEFD